MTREEAIERIKYSIGKQAWALDENDTEALYEVIPELRESEDEKVRKEIIGYLESKVATAEETELLYFKRWIAYLEKQKEQKPAKWSKNDTVFFNEITDFFENKTGRLQHDLDMYAHWLKSLPQRFNFQPKPEWSEEWDEFDEDCLKRAIWYVENPAPSVVKDTNLVLWLKSLKNRGNFLKSNTNSPSWKPSEEQKDGLFHACNRMTGDYYHNALVSLYEDLKKLREE